jgi:hypothetical protein
MRIYVWRRINSSLSKHKEKNGTIKYQGHQGSRTDNGDAAYLGMGTPRLYLDLGCGLFFAVLVATRGAMSHRKKRGGNIKAKLIVDIGVSEDGP